MDLRLRKISEADTANIVRWRNSDDVRRWLYTQDDLTEEMHLGWLKNVVGKGRCAQYIIEGVVEGNLTDIGTIFIKRPSSDSLDGEYGIFIGEATARGKHMALPATRQILDIGFNELKLELIYLSVFKENIPAVKTYLKAGFKIVDEYEYDEDSSKKIYKMEIRKEDYVTTLF